MVRGSVYTAMSLVRNYVSEERFALLAAVSELGRRFVSTSSKACWQHAPLSLPKSFP